MTPNERYRRTWKGAYTLHKINAKRRGVPFELTPTQWRVIWFVSGHWRQRGPRMGQYVMHRLGDVGPYAWGNVFIGGALENLIDGGSRTRFLGRRVTDAVPESFIEPADQRAQC